MDAIMRRVGRTVMSLRSSRRIWKVIETEMEIEIVGLWCRMDIIVRSLLGRVRSRRSIVMEVGADQGKGTDMRDIVMEIWRR